MSAVGLAEIGRGCVLVLAAVAAGCSSLPQNSWRGFGRGEGSATELARADTGDPRQVAKLCIVTAEGLEGEGHWREAALLYEKARANDGEAIDYARRLAVLYARQQRPREALAEYQKALRDAPQDADLLNDFAWFQYEQGELSQAESLLRQALAQDGQHASAWTNLGIVLAHQRRYGESFQAFSRVGSAAAAHANLGAVLLKLGDTEQAGRELRQALTLDPSLAQPRALLAYLDQRAAPAGSAVLTAGAGMD